MDAALQFPRFVVVNEVGVKTCDGELWHYAIVSLEYLHNFQARMLIFWIPR